MLSVGKGIQVVLIGDLKINVLNILRKKKHLNINLEKPNYKEIRSE